VSYRWDCGDGVNLKGRNVSHTYTRAGNFTVTLHATGVANLVGSQSFPLSITGRITTRFIPNQKRRYQSNEQ
jgi:PKD repeat protein